MKIIDLDNISTIEEYLLHLGTFSVSLNGLFKLQKIACKKGILNEEEMENAETIQYEINRLFTTLNDQVKMVTCRTPLEWSEVLSRVKNLLQIEKESKNKIK